ncbi:ABC transporter permease [Vibrio sp. 10N]|uniref:ABC transporter permease n=1 Tax=Vibrio sp. 10N TaxID=3058938 RepID=UPI00281382D8|nr:ABC transporter permease [Vibrio sp. 10N]
MAQVKKRSTLAVWKDVIFAIFLREIKSKFNDKLGIAWSIISPVSFIFLLSFMRGKMDGGNTHGVPTFFFMVYGMILIQFFLGTVEVVSNSIKKNKPLYAFRQVQPISSVLAIAGFEFLVKVFVILTIAMLCLLLKMEHNIDDPIEVIFIVVRVWLLATSIGLITALASSYVPEVSKLQTLAMRPLFFISGIFFSLQDIPREYWHYLDWNPLLHAVELARYAAYSGYGTEGVSDFYLDTVTIVLVFFSLACYHVGWKQAISR